MRRVQGLDTINIDIAEAIHMMKDGLEVMFDHAQFLVRDLQAGKCRYMADLGGS